MIIIDSNYLKMQQKFQDRLQKSGPLLKQSLSVLWLPTLDQTIPALSQLV